MAQPLEFLKSAYENIETGEPNSTKLKQQKQTIIEKLETLSRLDAQILDLTPVDNLEEIEQADIIREKLTLCIIDIESATEHAGSAVKKGEVPAGTVTVPVVMAEHTTSDGGDTERTVDGTTDETLHRTEPPPSSEDAVHTPATGIPGVVPAPGVKLPKLTTRKFNGDLTRWVTFWDSFESAVHNNPSLTDVDKFNYLKSYLESSAAEAIAGLTLTSANYAEAVATPKRRFGNTQLIVNKHMEGLLGLTTVESHNHVQDLRHLFDAVESHVRGLRALGVPAETYGGMLTSILMNKLPPEIRLIVSRELTSETWAISDVLATLEKEVAIRERALASSHTDATQRSKTPATASSLLTNSGVGTCVYCNQEHQSSSCRNITDVSARREVLRKSGRCYVASEETTSARIVGLCLSAVYVRGGTMYRFVRGPVSLPNLSPLEIQDQTQETPALE